MALKTEELKKGGELSLYTVLKSGLTEGYDMVTTSEYVYDETYGARLSEINKYILNRVDGILDTQDLYLISLYKLSSDDVITLTDEQRNYEISLLLLDDWLYSLVFSTAGNIYKITAKTDTDGNLVAQSDGFYWKQAELIGKSTGTSSVKIKSLTIYAIGLTEKPATPLGGIYDFSTGSVTGITWLDADGNTISNIYQSVPDGASNVYFSYAVAVSTQKYVTWSTPMRMIMSSLELLSTVLATIKNQFIIYSTLSTLPSISYTALYDTDDNTWNLYSGSNVWTSDDDWTTTKPTDTSTIKWIAYNTFTYDPNVTEESDRISSTGWIASLYVDIDGILETALELSEEYADSLVNGELQKKATLAVTDALNSANTQISLALSDLLDATNSMQEKEEELATLKSLYNQEVIDIQAKYDLYFDETNGEVTKAVESLGDKAVTLKQVTLGMSELGLFLNPYTPTLYEALESKPNGTCSFFIQGSISSTEDCTFVNSGEQAGMAMCYITDDTTNVGIYTNNFNNEAFVNQAEVTALQSLGTVMIYCTHATSGMIDTSYIFDQDLGLAELNTYKDYVNGKLTTLGISGSSFLDGKYTSLQAYIDALETKMGINLAKALDDPNQTAITYVDQTLLEAAVNGIKASVSSSKLYLYDSITLTNGSSTNTSSDSYARVIELHPNYGAIIKVTCDDTIAYRYAISNSNSGITFFNDAESPYYKDNGDVRTYNYQTISDSSVLLIITSDILKSVQKASTDKVYIYLWYPSSADIATNTSTESATFNIYYDIDTALSTLEITADGISAKVLSEINSDTTKQSNWANAILTSDEAATKIGLMTFNGTTIAGMQSLILLNANAISSSVSLYNLADASTYTLNSTTAADETYTITLPAGKEASGGTAGYYNSPYYIYFSGGTLTYSLDGVDKGSLSSGTEIALTNTTLALKLTIASYDSETASKLAISVKVGYLVNAAMSKFILDATGFTTTAYVDNKYAELNLSADEIKSELYLNDFAECDSFRITSTTDVTKSITLPVSNGVNTPYYIKYTGGTLKYAIGTSVTDDSETLESGTDIALTDTAQAVNFKAVSFADESNPSILVWYGYKQGLAFSTIKQLADSIETEVAGITGDNGSLTKLKQTVEEISATAESAKYTIFKPDVTTTSTESEIDIPYSCEYKFIWTSTSNRNHYSVKVYQSDGTTEVTDLSFTGDLTGLIAFYNVVSLESGYKIKVSSTLEEVLNIYYETSVALSELDIEPGTIQAKVSEYMKSDDGLEALSTAVTKATSGSIETTVTGLVDKKMSGYSTTELTKEAITSIVGTHISNLIALDTDDYTVLVCTEENKYSLPLSTTLKSSNKYTLSMDVSASPGTYVEIYFSIGSYEDSYTINNSGSSSVLELRIVFDSFSGDSSDNKIYLWVNNLDEDFDISIANVMLNYGDNTTYYKYTENLTSMISQNKSSISSIVTGIGSNGKVTTASIIAGINTEQGNGGSYINLTADLITAAGTLIADQINASGLNIDDTTYIHGTDDTTGIFMNMASTNIFYKDGSFSLAGGGVKYEDSELTVEGIINANGGSIGGWTIADRYMYTDNDSARMLLSAGTILATATKTATNYSSSDSDILWYLNSDGEAMFAKGHAIFKSNGLATIGTSGSCITISESGEVTISGTKASITISDITDAINGDDTSEDAVNLANAVASKASNVALTADNYVTYLSNGTAGFVAKAYTGTGYSNDDVTSYYSGRKTLSLGEGYLANGNIYWDSDGALTILGNVEFQGMTSKFGSDVIIKNYYISESISGIVYDSGIVTDGPFYDNNTGVIFPEYEFSSDCIFRGLGDDTAYSSISDYSHYTINNYKGEIFINRYTKESDSIIYSTSDTLGHEFSGIELPDPEKYVGLTLEYEIPISLINGTMLFESICRGYVLTSTTSSGTTFSNYGNSLKSAPYFFINSNKPLNRFVKFISRETASNSNANTNNTNYERSMFLISSRLPYDDYLDHEKYGYEKSLLMEKAYRPGMEFLRFYKNAGLAKTTMIYTIKGIAYGTVISIKTDIAPKLSSDSKIMITSDNLNWVEYTNGSSTSSYFVEFASGRGNEIRILLEESADLIITYENNTELWPFEGIYKANELSMTSEYCIIDRAYVPVYNDRSSDVYNGSYYHEYITGGNIYDTFIKNNSSYYGDSGYTFSDLHSLYELVCDSDDSDLDNCISISLHYLFGNPEGCKYSIPYSTDGVTIEDLVSEASSGGLYLCVSRPALERIREGGTLKLKATAFKSHEQYGYTSEDWYYWEITTLDFIPNFLTNGYCSNKDIDSNMIIYTNESYKHSLGDDGSYFIGLDYCVSDNSEHGFVLLIHSDLGSLSAIDDYITTYFFVPCVYKDYINLYSKLNNNKQIGFSESEVATYLANCF